MTLGIALGLFVGKQIGITGAAWIAVKLGIASMPRGTHWGGIYGTSLVAGIGFTMSLFIGMLAFSSMGHHYLVMVRLGVLLGSLLSGVCGYVVLRFIYPPALN